MVQTRPAWRPVRPPSRRCEKKSSGLAARAQLARPRPTRRPARSSRRRATSRRSSIRPVGDAGAERLEGVQHLVAHLVAAGADPGADRRRPRLDLLHPALRRSPRPARASRSGSSPRRPVPRAPPAGSRRRTRAAPGPGRAVAWPSASGRPGAGFAYAPGLGRPVVAGHLGAVDLPADQDELADRSRGRRPGGGGSRAPRRAVAGQPPQVEALERALADAAEAGAERRLRAGQLGLQPPDSVSLAPAHSARWRPTAWSFETKPGRPSDSRISIRSRMYGMGGVRDPRDLGLGAHVARLWTAEITVSS